MAIRTTGPNGEYGERPRAAGMALPELLAPAGGLDQMLAAIAAGADAVYAGLGGFNARVTIWASLICLSLLGPGWRRSRSKGA